VPRYCHEVRKFPLERSESIGATLEGPTYVAPIDNLNCDSCSSISSVLDNLPLVSSSDFTLSHVFNVTGALTPPALGTDDRRVPAGRRLTEIFSTEWLTECLADSNVVAVPRGDRRWPAALKERVVAETMLDATARNEFMTYQSCRIVRTYRRIQIGILWKCEFGHFAL
jgi:hypothetical protein